MPSSNDLLSLPETLLTRHPLRCAGRADALAGETLPKSRPLGLECSDLGKGILRTGRRSAKAIAGSRHATKYAGCGMSRAWSGSDWWVGCDNIARLGMDVERILR